MDLYSCYAKGRDLLGWRFTRHRTWEAFHSQSPWSAWRKACADNDTEGSPFLPAGVKAGCEVLGVLLIALVGIIGRRKTSWIIALLAAGLLSMTASKQEETGSSGGGDDSSFGEETEGYSPEQIATGLAAIQIAISQDSNTCPFCFQPIDWEAQVCPLCGGQVLDPEEEEGYFFEDE